MVHGILGLVSEGFREVAQAGSSRHALRLELCAPMNADCVAQAAYSARILFVMSS